MKRFKTKRFSLLSILVVVVLMLVGYLMYEKTWDQSFMFVVFWLLFIVLWIAILNKKENFFLDDIKWMFYNNEKAWKVLYKVWAILAFLIWILSILNTTTHIFANIYIWNIVTVATILTLLITLVYLFKYKK